MSNTVSSLGRTLLSRLGIIAVLAGSALIFGENFASITFTPANGRIESLEQRCELIESYGSNRSAKIITEGTCDEVAAFQTQMSSVPLQIRSYPAAMVSFRDGNGRQVTSRAHVAGLGVNDPHPGDTIPILYRPSDPSIVRGPASGGMQGVAACAVLVGVMMLFAQRKL